MKSNTTPSWLGEALASYQPSSISSTVWARFRPELAVLLARMNVRDERDARRILTRVAAFLGDLTRSRPEASLTDLLTRDQVEGHLQRALADGLSASTVRNRQGTLNALLRAQAGQRPHANREAEQHLTPYELDELLTVMDAAATDGGPAAADLARTIASALAGQPVPTRRTRDRVMVEVDGRTVSVHGGSRDFPDDVDLPGSGSLDHAGVQRGRDWARRSLGFRLDIRRLSLTHLTELVAAQPAVDVLRLDGVGRDRLTAAVAAASLPSAARIRQYLRCPGSTAADART